MLSTAQVAERSGVPLRTLKRWMVLGKVRANTVVRQGDRKVHLWAATDVQKVRRYKREHFREGAGRRTDLQTKRSRKRRRRA